MFSGVEARKVGTISPMTAVTCVMPTYNRADLLMEALQSILDQTRPVAEIIVWDDGSVDGTAAAVKALARRHSVIRYFHGANGGKSRVINRALIEARGEAVWICDDDDLCRADAAARLVAMMEKTGAEVVGGAYVRFGVDPATGVQVEADPGYRPDLSSGSMLRHLLEDMFLFQNATLVARKAYERVGPFREDLNRAIDYDMIIRLAARFPVAYVDAVLFEQRKHDGARGPRAARHEATMMDEVWAAADRDVFRAFRTVLPLSLYEAMFEAGDSRLVARAARLQRGTVYARKGLWSEACDDYEAALVQAIDEPLTATEMAILKRALGGKHGCDGILERSVRARLSAIRRRDFKAALAAGLRWRIREASRRDFAAAASFAALALHLSPVSVATGRASGWDGVAERDAPPAEAYLW